jgi:hypothetical protein
VLQTEKLPSYLPSSLVESFSDPVVVTSYSHAMDRSSDLNISFSASSLSSSAHLGSLDPALPGDVSTTPNIERRDPNDDRVQLDVGYHIGSDKPYRIVSDIM